MIDAPGILKQFQRDVNYLSRDLGWRLGWNHSYVSQAKGARILAYHGLCKGDPFLFNTLFIRQKNFEKSIVKDEVCDRS